MNKLTAPPLNQLIPQIVILPNPSHDFIYISGLNSNSKTKITITNNYGTIMQSATIENSNLISINISNLQPGFYYVKIVEGKSTQKKIIKQSQQNYFLLCFFLFLCDIIFIIKLVLLYFPFLHY